MTVVDLKTLLDWRGRTVIARHGEKLGKLGALYLDAGTERPAYGGIHTGVFGRHESVVPLDALFEDEQGDLRLPFSVDEIRGAPNVDPDAVLTAEEEVILRDYYGVAGSAVAPAAQDDTIRSEDAITAAAGAPVPAQRGRLRKVPAPEHAAQRDLPQEEPFAPADDVDHRPPPPPPPATTI